MDAEHTLYRMRYARDDPGDDRIATFDIETTATDPTDGELVSVGVGVHDRAEPLTEATYETFHREDGEASLVDRAMTRLAAADADALVTYNGIEFDLPFVEGRLDRLGADVDLPAVASQPGHLDLFLDRKRRADEAGEKWPSLEACLESYGHAPPQTVWRGAPLTNGRFGEELGPAYLRTLGTETGARFRASLAEVVDHYLIGDLEATLALYYADLGESVEGAYLGTERRFD
ncbi:ribonuclease H-like domain-containing protein [Haloplanus rubicundus]|nr:ribonuclease H-like domain-containing protein [Haloplanus rubicundus]